MGTDGDRIHDNSDHIRLYYCWATFATQRVYYFSYFKLKNILEENPNVRTVYLGFSYHNLSSHYDEYDKKYPEYGFAQHKGYGTAQHVEAIRKYGPCPIHRCSFEPIRSMMK